MPSELETISLRVPRAMKMEIDRRSELAGQSRSSYMIDALKSHFRQDKSADRKQSLLKATEELADRARQRDDGMTSAEIDHWIRQLRANRG